MNYKFIFAAVAAAIIFTEPVFAQTTDRYPCASNIFVLVVESDGDLANAFDIGAAAPTAFTVTSAFSIGTRYFFLAFNPNPTTRRPDPIDEKNKTLDQLNALHRVSTYCEEEAEEPSRKTAKNTTTQI